MSEKRPEVSRRLRKYQKDIKVQSCRGQTHPPPGLKIKG